MEYKLLDHDEYSHPDHPPAETVGIGDTVILVFKGTEGYKVTEARMATVVSMDAENLVGELVQPGMMIPVTAGQRVTFTRRQAFQPEPFGDETFLSIPGT